MAEAAQPENSTAASSSSSGQTPVPLDYSRSASSRHQADAVFTRPVGVMGIECIQG
jgi:hypothetical protein